MAECRRNLVRGASQVGKLELEPGGLCWECPRQVSWIVAGLFSRQFSVPVRCASVRIRTLRKKRRSPLSQQPREPLKEREQVPPPDECERKENEAHCLMEDKAGKAR